MENNGRLLADAPNFGRVYDCGGCGNIHLSVGAVTITLTPSAYIELVALVNTGAANIETWLRRRNEVSPYETEVLLEKLRDTVIGLHQNLPRRKEVVCH